MRRLIASVRLSRDTDVTNSPATQRADIEDWVDDHPGNAVVAWTEDLDTSGAMPIRERPGIGPWLDDAKLGDWDGIIGYRLDRLFRSQLDYLLWVRDIGKEHRKVIVDIEDGADTSTQEGVRRLNDRARDADYERQRMVERRTKAAKRIRLEGRWNGGVVPFGYTAERHPVKGWRLVPDPEHARVLKRMVRDLLDGKSLNQIAEWLNAEGVPSPTDITRERYGNKKPRGIGWKPTSVRVKLRNPAITGVTTYKGEIVRGNDGLPVMRAEPIIDAATYARVKEVLARPAGRQGGNRPSRMLLHVAYCALCDGILYGKRNARNAYYECINTTPARGTHERCTARMMRVDELERAVDDTVMDALGWVPEMAPAIGSPSSDRDEKLAEVGHAIADLTAERYVRGIVRDNYGSMIADLQAEHDRLSALPAEQKPNRVPTGKTMEEVWPGWDAGRKRSYFLDRGWKVFAVKGMPGFPPSVVIEHGDLYADIAALAGVTVDELLRARQEYVVAILSAATERPHVCA
jgi:site-specific DNA recombinase